MLEDLGHRVAIAASGAAALELVAAVEGAAAEAGVPVVLAGAVATIGWWVASLVTGRVGIDGVAQAFADLANPEAHTKILVEPWR